MELIDKKRQIIHYARILNRIKFYHKHVNMILDTMNCCRDRYEYIKKQRNKRCCQIVDYIASFQNEVAQDVNLPIESVLTARTFKIQLDAMRKAGYKDQDIELDWSKLI